MLYCSYRRSDLGVVLATLSSDMRGANPSCSAAASFFTPHWEITPTGKRLCLLCACYVFIFFLQLGSDISSHPLFEDRFLLQADKLFIASFSSLYFICFPFICDGLPQNIFTFQNIVSLCKSKRSTISFSGSLDRGLLLCDILSRDISIF